MKDSKKWTLNTPEIKAIVRNALIFLAPVALVVIGIIQTGGGIDKISVAIQVWALGVLTDFFRKLSAGK